MIEKVHCNFILAASSRKGHMILFDIAFYSINLKSHLLLGFVFIHLFAHGQVLDSAVSSGRFQENGYRYWCRRYMLGTNFPNASYLPPNQAKMS